MNKTVKNRSGSLRLKAHRSLCFFVLFAVLFSILFFRSGGMTGEVNAAVNEVQETINRRGYVNCSAYLRSGPTTASSKLLLLNPSTALDVFESVRGAPVSGSDLWYRVRVVKGGKEGYIHAPLVTLSDTPISDPSNPGSDPPGGTSSPEFEAYLREQGFPESYKPALRKLHAAHPSWVFQAARVYDRDNLSKLLPFAKAVEKEYAPIKRANGTYTTLSVVPPSAPVCEYSFEAPYYNFRNNTWIFVDAGGWKPANREIVAYTMDPRTWLNEQQIFQFESLSYHPEVQTLTMIHAALKGTFMESEFERYPAAAPPDPPAGSGTDPTELPPADSPTDPSADPPEDPVEEPLPKGCVKYTGDDGVEYIKTYAEIFIDAARLSGVNPFFLVQRCISEVSPSGSRAVRGVEPGYEGYYNFYSIHASAGADPILNGLKYARYGATSTGPTASEKEAYLLPWNNPWRAVVGGAKWIGYGYISKGQDTSYAQKFNLDGRTGCAYWHQYMANIYAPQYESSKTFVSYLKQKVLETPFVFKIPVMADMPAEPSPYPTIMGNRNNYLLSLTVSSGTLTPSFDPETYAYKVSVPAGTASVTVGAKNVSGTGSTIQNLGLHALNVGENRVAVKCTAESGEIREYTLDITRPADPDDLPDVPNDPDIQLPAGVSLKDDYRVRGRFLVNAWPDDDRNLAGRIKSGFSLPAGMRIEISQPSGDPVTEDTRLGTGAAIALFQDGSEQPVASLQLVIYGDATGDGRINSNDISALLDFMYKDARRSEPEQAAMDVWADSRINSNDISFVLDYMYKDIIISQQR